MTPTAHQDDPTSALRPAVPKPAPRRWQEPVAVAMLLAASVYWILAPLWPNLSAHILGDKDTDTIRGMWGFDHLRRSMIPPNTPLWSDMVNFPEGAVALVLPWISGRDRSSMSRRSLVTGALGLSPRIVLKFG